MDHFKRCEIRYNLYKQTHRYNSQNREQTYFEKPSGNRKPCVFVVTYVIPLEVRDEFRFYQLSIQTYNKTYYTATADFWGLSRSKWKLCILMTYLHVYIYNL